MKFFNLKSFRKSTDSSNDKRLAAATLAGLTALSMTVAVLAGMALRCAPVSAAESAAKFVTVEPVDGIWWFVDPQGKGFISEGVDTVTFNQDNIQNTKDCPYAKNSLEKYKSQESWRQATAARLLSLNFNTLGAWSDPKVAQENPGKKPKKQHLYHTVILHAADAWDNWNRGGLPDFFDPKFEESVIATADKICKPFKDDDRLIGYFGDNEMLWVNKESPLLMQYLNGKADSPARQAAFMFLQKHYTNFAEFNRTWKTEFSSWQQLNQASKIVAATGDRDSQEKFEKDCDVFAGYAATRYFAIVDHAMKLADPNHLNLGCRFSGYPGAAILRACAAHTDVVSFNCYEVDPAKTIRKYALGGKPLLIGEFSFRGVDSGLPNTKGAGPVVRTQKERGDFFASYVKTALANPNVIGYHWFEHVDQPREGRFDGENSNYGIASIQDEPYMDMTNTMKAINLQARVLHSKAIEQ